MHQNKPKFTEARRNAANTANNITNPDGGDKLGMSRRLKERAPLWLWAIIIIVVIIIVVLACVQVFGIMDLSFIPAGYLGIFQWAGSDIFNGLIITTLAVLIFGAAGYYLKGYRGIKTSPGQLGAGYAPTPVYPSQTGEENKTVIS